MASITETQLQQLVQEYKNTGEDYNISTPNALKIHVTRDIPFKKEHRNVVKNEPRHLREDPVAFMMNVGLYYQGTGWRGYKDYIGAKILYPGFSARIKQIVLSSKKVQQVIDELADRQTKTLVAQKKWGLNDKRIEKQRKRLRQELEVISHSIANKSIAIVDKLSTLRLFSFIVNNVLVRLYHQGVHIRESEWIELKRIALMAQHSKKSLIFLPSHKSHIDYLVVSYLMFRLGIQIPHVIAGDNLDIPLVGTLLKSSGGIFIRREWGDDVLYKSVLEEYIVTLLMEGMNFECYVEGGRSRIGKLLQPKLGIIKIILDGLIDKRFEDCYVVPISIGYDKIIETSSYATELLGTPKKKESLWGVLTNSRLLQLKWGRVDVRLNKPFSMREWLDNQIQARGIINPEDPNQKSILLKSFGYRVLADINDVSVVMPSALISTVILTLRGRGVGRSELIRRVVWLKQVIEDKGGQVSEFYDMPIGDIVDKTVLIHKDLIGELKGKDIVEPTFYPITSFELSYYRNQVIHLFVEEAIACAALYTVVKKGGGKTLQRMRYTDFLNEVSFLSSLLKLDMIYKPGGIESNTHRAIQWLTNNKVIEATDDGWIGLNDLERQCGRENYDFLCFLIWPYIESYWLSAVSLFTLTHSNNQETIWIDGKLFLSRAQSLGKTLYHQGDVSYLEAANKETMSNAFSRYEEQGILLRKRHSAPKIWSEVTINKDYIPERQNGEVIPKGPLWDLVEHIGIFRREGKNRRDNATVSTRVLRLASMLAEDNRMSTTAQKGIQIISKI